MERPQPIDLSLVEIEKALRALPLPATVVLVHLFKMKNAVIFGSNYLTFSEGNK